MDRQSSEVIKRLTESLNEFELKEDNCIPRNMRYKKPRGIKNPMFYCYAISIIQSFAGVDRFVLGLIGKLPVIIPPHESIVIVL